jgi:ubiquinone/menaquinone biosynthesis C-methylase UbiE
VVTTEHNDLFVSGAYVGMFQPEAPTNPFKKIYAAKRDAVIATVAGYDQDVLDVGGGMGRIAIPLAERHRVVLTDLSADMLKLARPSAGPRLQLQVAGATRLPFPDASFDWVVCIDLIPHLLDPKPALAEARRVVRRGGHIVIDSTNSVPLWTLAYPRYLGRNPRRWIQIWRGAGIQPEWQSRVWHYPRRRFMGMVARAGFSVRSVRGFGPIWCPKWHLAVAEAI